MFKLIQLAFFALFLFDATAFSQNVPYEKYTLTESDLPGYELIGMSETRLNTGLQRAIKQVWKKEGEEKLKTIIISTAVFENEIQAISGMTNLKGSYSVLFEFGTLTSCTIGDKSWSNLGTVEAAILLTRGNVGVVIDQMASSSEEISFLENLSKKILDKIEKNLSNEIKASEEQARAFQIPLVKYEELVNNAINLPAMQGFSLTSEWDSKWKVDETTLVMGRRVEWKNSTGAIVGIDMAEFDTETAARQAMEIRLHEVDAHISSPRSVFQVDAPSSIDSLVATWQSHLFASRIISGISAKGKVAIHIYHYNPQGNDTALFSAVTKEMANKISF